MLSEKAIAEYLEPLTEEQRGAITSIRNLLITHLPDLVETVDTGKWFTGLLTYHLPSGAFAFALGPRGEGQATFHMMAYYASPSLKTRNEAELKKFLTGKSCIRFKEYAILPEESLVDIIINSPKGIEEMMKAREKKISGK